MPLKAVMGEAQPAEIAANIASPASQTVRGLDAAL